MEGSDDQTANKLAENTICIRYDRQRYEEDKCNPLSGDDEWYGKEIGHDMQHEDGHKGEGVGEEA